MEGQKTSYYLDMDWEEFLNMIILVWNFLDPAYLVEWSVAAVNVEKQMIEEFSRRRKGHTVHQMIFVNLSFVLSLLEMLTLFLEHLCLCDQKLVIFFYSQGNPSTEYTQRGHLLQAICHIQTGPRTISFMKCWMHSWHFFHSKSSKSQFRSGFRASICPGEYWRMGKWIWINFFTLAKLFWEPVCKGCVTLRSFGSSRWGFDTTDCSMICPASQLWCYLRPCALLQSCRLWCTLQ